MAGMATSSQMANLQHGQTSFVEGTSTRRAVMALTVQQSGEFGDDLRRMNSERVKLDEELRVLEDKEIKEIVDAQVRSYFPRLIVFKV